MYLVSNYAKFTVVRLKNVKSLGRGIIDAADKYGVVNLKLDAEVIFVEGTTFTMM